MVRGSGAVVRHPDLYSGEFYVQVGAFVNEGNAQRLARRLRRFWEQVEVFRVTAPDGRTFHRVQVYVGDNLGIARRREASLVRAGFTRGLCGSPLKEALGCPAKAYEHPCRQFARNYVWGRARTDGAVSLWPLHGW